MARQTDIAALNVRLVASTKGLESGLNRAQLRLKKFEGSAKRLGARLGAAMKKIAVGITAGFTIALAGAVLAIRSTANEIDSLAKTSRTLGITTEALGAFRIAASRAGVDVGLLEKSIQKMQQGLFKGLLGGKREAEAFALLGLNIRELLSLSPAEQFAQISDALNKVQSSAKRLELSSTIFGARGAGVTRISGDALRSAAAEGGRLGLLVSSSQAAGVENMLDQFGRLKDAIRGIAMQITVTLAPVIEKIAGKLEPILQKVVATIRGMVRLFMALKLQGLSTIQALAVVLKQLLNETLLPMIREVGAKAGELVGVIANSITSQLGLKGVDPKLVGEAVRQSIPAAGGTQAISGVGKFRGLAKFGASALSAGVDNVFAGSSSPTAAGQAITQKFLEGIVGGRRLVARGLGKLGDLMGAGQERTNSLLEDQLDTSAKALTFMQIQAASLEGIRQTARFR